MNKKKEKENICHFPLLTSQHSTTWEIRPHIHFWPQKRDLFCSYYTHNINSIEKPEDDEMSVSWELNQQGKLNSVRRKKRFLASKECRTKMEKEEQRLQTSAALFRIWKSFGARVWGLKPLKMIFEQSSSHLAVLSHSAHHRQTHVNERKLRTSGRIWYFRSNLDWMKNEEWKSEKLTEKF